MAKQSRRDIYPQIGGHRILDLLNTVEWRLNVDKRVDDVTDYEDLLRWAGQVGLVSEADAAPLRAVSSRSQADAATEFARVRELRESLYSTLLDDGTPAVLKREYSDAVGGGGLRRVGNGWRWDLPLDLARPRRMIAIEAFDLLTRADLSLLAQCQDAECGWVFLDTSPRHNRRWCVASDCGNRNRARDFYRRNRLAST